ncbi:class I SAM-dependent methyltransferase [Kibdelosporangium aridum]|uniref:Putative zinc binding domain-containing protein n=1 Tax=Kibdelosporangium aridum TaxID=2030 RepID=A0A1W2D4W6_KIBAR|nr:class I SAM-dependent methyltransferase [Kibdelosporangium aridum]SMC92557.1 Putative zinc binding domain-containing protein [Kibdelosporangium aridum]
MLTPICRSCRARRGEVVLDLGRQPASDFFPPLADNGPDPVYPLRMWLCAECGLAQLAEDPTVPEEPRGVEPAALVAQAKDAIERVMRSGLVKANAQVFEYGSPHGGSWLPMLAEHGLRAVEQPSDPADVVLDSFGMMHSADQHEAVAERARRLTDGGILLLQYHSLATIIRNGQWNALRHGHYAYYSTAALTRMLSIAGLTPWTAWRFDLYGGTVLLAAGRGGQSDPEVRALMAEETGSGVDDPRIVRSLQETAENSINALRGWLQRQRGTGRRVFGYGAASRAVALLAAAGIDNTMLSGVADASQAKWGRRMPGTAIPVISPAELVRAKPDAVLLFVPDLLEEVRAALPALAGRWVVAEPVPTEDPQTRRIIPPARLAGDNRS